MSKPAIAESRVLEALRGAFPHWRERLGADHVLSLDVLSQIGGSALTDDVAIAMRADGLPTTFVPGRNLVFLTFAAALAYRRGLRAIVGGMCETDYSGYPDCRDETIQAMQTALNLGMAHDFALHTPLMWLDKAATWALARDLEDMDRFGTETAILSGFVPTRGDVETRRKAARVLNDFATKLRSDHPVRFGNLAALPLRDFDNDGCLREIEYASDTLKVDGFFHMTSYGDAWAGDERWAPVYQVLNRRKAIVHVHPQGPACCSGRWCASIAKRRCRAFRRIRRPPENRAAYR